jgi:hypothetical protein
MKMFNVKLLFAGCLVSFVFPLLGYAATAYTDADGSRIVKGVDDKGAITPGIQSSQRQATIIVDGDPSDWVGIPDLITDPKGDGGDADIVSIKVANDRDFVYILQKFASLPSGYSFLMLDSDLNLATGCNAYGVGSEYGITFDTSTSENGYIGDSKDCGWSPNDFPGALSYVVSGKFIEASIPISTLGILSPGLTAFDITAANDSTAIARYSLGGTYASDIRGCIELKGSPVVNVEVELTQPHEHKKKSTKTDANGCYKFKNAVSGKKFNIIIDGPVVP